MGGICNELCPVSRGDKQPGVASPLDPPPLLRLLLLPLLLLLLPLLLRPPARLPRLPNVAQHRLLVQLPAAAARLHRQDHGRGLGQGHTPDQQASCISGLCFRV